MKSLSIGSNRFVDNLQSSNFCSKKLAVCGFAIPIVIGLCGLACAGIGLAGFFRIGAMSHLNQITAIVMMGVGGSCGIVLSVVGVFGLVKSLKANRQVERLQLDNIAFQHVFFYTFLDIEPLCITKDGRLKKEDLPSNGNGALLVLILSDVLRLLDYNELYAIFHEYPQLTLYITNRDMGLSKGYNLPTDSDQLRNAPASFQIVLQQGWDGIRVPVEEVEAEKKTVILEFKKIKPKSKDQSFVVRVAK